MKMWSRGRLLMTNQTNHWPVSVRIEAEKREKEIIYTNFSSTDQGRARKQVCWVNPEHPDFEENMALIRLAPVTRNLYNIADKQLMSLKRMSRWEKLKWVFSR